MAATIYFKWITCNKREVHIVHKTFPNKNMNIYEGRTYCHRTKCHRKNVTDQNVTKLNCHRTKCPRTNVRQTKGHTGQNVTQDKMSHRDKMQGPYMPCFFLFFWGGSLPCFPVFALYLGLIGAKILYSSILINFSSFFPFLFFPKDSSKSVRTTQRGYLHE